MHSFPISLIHFIVKLALFQYSPKDKETKDSQLTKQAHGKGMSLSFVGIWKMD